jgi:SAM-dependent methyltransferase
MTLKGKISSLIHNPTIVKDILQAKNRGEIRGKIIDLEQKRTETRNKKEVYVFISRLKKCSSYSIDPNQKSKLNRLCCLEDWENIEIKNIIYELQNFSSESYEHRKDWAIPEEKKMVGMRGSGLIHRKDWEWALGLVAMRRFGKLNKNNIALGIGVGREEVLFHLANSLGHVYATDLYDGKQWDNFAPFDFPENPKKYAPFPYNEDALTILRMDGTNIGFPPETFDIAFSFSSIEHFGGKNHAGALQSVKEMERVLKKGGIAVIATEYIVNDKDHPEFFNRRTIYSDLINKLDSLKLVESLDLRITTKTLETVMDYPDAVHWDTSGDDDFKKNHPLLLIRVGNLLLTSVMIVLKKI